MESKNLLIQSLQDILYTMGFEEVPADKNLLSVWDDNAIDPTEFILEIERRYDIHIPDEILDSISEQQSTLNELADKLLLIINN